MPASTFTTRSRDGTGHGQRQARARQLPASALAGLRTTARPLDPEVRADMEARFRWDFASIRIHRDSAAARSAKALNARAYAVGDDIVFGAGEYAPCSLEGKKLLAHELAHAVQQRRGGPRLPTYPAEPDRRLEADAQQAAEAVVGTDAPVRVTGASAPGLALAPEPPDIVPPRPAAESLAKLNAPRRTEAEIVRNRGMYRGRFYFEMLIDESGSLRVDLLPDDMRTSLRAMSLRNKHFSPSTFEAYMTGEFGDFGDRGAVPVEDARQGGPAEPDAVTDEMPARARQEQMERARQRAALADGPESPQPTRPVARRGAGSRRGAATVGGVLFNVVAVGSALYVLGESENIQDLTSHSAELAAEAAAGAAVFRLMGPASAFLSLEGDNPDIARNRQTMAFIHARFGHWFESDPQSGEETYVGPGDFMTLFREASDLLFNTDAIALPPPLRTRGHPSPKDSMAPVRSP